MNYDSTSNIWGVEKFYDPGDNSFIEDSDMHLLG